MKLLVLSDSHGDTERLAAALRAHEDAAAAFFLGDGVRDMEWLERSRPQLPVYMVRGNCDLASPYPTEGLAPFGGKAIFYTHGHLYGVKSGLDTLAHVALARGADIALYGHTHRAAIERCGGVLLFNPGAVSDYRGAGSCGVLNLENGRAEASVWML